MNLAKLVTSLKVEAQPGKQWAIIGPEATAFGPKLKTATPLTRPDPELDGLLLAGALSAQENAAVWLTDISHRLKAGASLVVVDWQGDGPLDTGPELTDRFKRGKLCRLLRAEGFGRIDILTNHALYYIVKAVKEPPPPTPHAGEFVAVARLDELSKNRMKVVTLFGKQLIVAHTGKEIVAIERACPHANVPLDTGFLRGQNIICPSHAYIWNVCTGEPLEPTDENSLPRYPVKVDKERGLILVALGALQA